MSFYIKKGTSFIVTLFLVSLLTFGVFHILPGDPALIILGPNADPLQLETLRTTLGLDTPLATRYLQWITHALQGNLGTSIRYHQSVSLLLKERILVSFTLSLMATCFTLLIGVPLGIYLAKTEDSFLGTLLSGITQLGIAIPSFWMGILLTTLFSLVLKWIPSTTYVPLTTSVKDSLISLILPSLSISLGTSCVLIRYLKNSIALEKKKPYVQTARSKGLSENAVLLKHILKNALIPTLTILGMLLVDILGGSIIIENVFHIPGLGNLMVNSINSRDFPLIQGIVLYLAFIVVTFNYLIDFLYTLVDPRIKVK
jgi:peptide/nickel transport system permease protein